MRMQKLVLGLSLAQIIPEKIIKMPSPDNLGFIDVNRTVRLTFMAPRYVQLQECRISKQNLYGSKHDFFRYSLFSLKLFLKSLSCFSKSEPKSILLL